MGMSEKGATAPVTSRKCHTLYHRRCPPVGYGYEVVPTQLGSDDASAPTLWLVDSRTVQQD